MTAAEQIFDRFANRMKDIQVMIDNQDAQSDDHNSDAIDTMLEWPLSVDREVQINLKIQLSWGGPADSFIVSLDGNNAIESVTYHYDEWFDPAEYRLTQAETELIMPFLECFLETE